MNPLVTLLASARLSRFLTTDKLGDWLIVRPAKDWAMRHEGEETVVVATSRMADGQEVATTYEKTGEPDEDNGWRSKLVACLECPFCAGFWAGGALLACDMLLPERGVARGVFSWGVKALALNYVAAHISSRLDADDFEVEN